jgi:hypothetical protein
MLAYWCFEASTHDWGGVAWIIGIAVACLVLGWLLGRWRRKPTTVVEETVLVEEVTNVTLVEED